MKKSIAIYLAFFSLLFAGVSCSGDDDGVTITGTPYAFISSFAIFNNSFGTFSIFARILAVFSLIV